MEMYVIVKAGFTGFALSLGVQMLVFYLVGTLFKVSTKRFVRIFFLAGVASFLAVDAFLYYRIRISQTPEAPFLLAGCVGGWLSGILFGLTQLRPYLMRFLR
jgi:hypothetical protein